MSFDPEHQRWIRAEEAAEAVRRGVHLKEADRQRGVAWSGLGPEPFHPRSDAAIAADAARRLQALGRFREGRAGRLLQAVTDAQRSAEAAHAAAEAARSALARDPRSGTGGCAAAVQALETEAAALLAAARSARTALAR